MGRDIWSEAELATGIVRIFVVDWSLALGIVGLFVCVP